MIIQCRYRFPNKGGYSTPLEAVPVRFRRDPEFHKQMKRLFEAYGGELPLSS